jgi:tetratricopeptide (TPR) repeat protein
VELTNNDLAQQGLLSRVALLARGEKLVSKYILAALPPEVTRNAAMMSYIKVSALESGDFASFVTLDRQMRYTDGLGIAHGVQDVNAAFVYMALGDRDTARARAGDGAAGIKADLEKQPTNASLWSNLSGAHVLLGDRAEALRCAQKAKDLVPESKDAILGPTYSLNYGACLAWLGEKDRALAELARLLRTPWGENIYLAKFGASWFPLRGDPRFEALVNDPKNNAPMIP